MCCKSDSPKTRLLAAWPSWWLLWLAFAALGRAAGAQPIENFWDSPSLRPVFQASWYGPAGSELYAALPLNYSTAKGNVFRLSDAFPFTQVSGLLGYSHRFNRYWNAGLEGQLSANRSGENLHLAFFAGHTGFLKKLELFKLAAYEVVSPLGGGSAFGRYSAFFQLRRDFVTAAGPFRLMASATLSKNHFYDPGMRFPDSERFIDNTRFGLEGQFLLGPKLAMGLFARQEAAHFFALETFDADGNMLKPYRKLNLNTPVFGLRLWFLVNPGSHPEKTYNLPSAIFNRPETPAVP